MDPFDPEVVDYQLEVVDSTSVESVRSRPGMYVGDTSDRGCLHLLLELAANAIDQFLAGAATEIVLEVGEGVTVWDDGAGLSREKARLHLSKPHFRPTGDGHAPHVHLKLSGVGLFPANALSSRLQMESFDENGPWSLTYERGLLVAEGEGSVTSGTRVSLTPDPELFTGRLAPALARRIVFDAVHLFPGLKIRLNQEVFFAADGLIDLVAFEAPHWQLTPSLNRDRSFSHHGQNPRFSLQVACLGESDGSPAVLSWVNGVATPGHGTHVDGVLQALELSDWTPAVVAVHLVMNEPDYAGPCRDQLRTGWVKESVCAELKEHLKAEEFRG